MSKPGAGFQFPKKVVPRRIEHEMMQAGSMNMAYVRTWLETYGIKLAPSTAGYGGVMEDGPPHWHAFNGHQDPLKNGGKVCFQVDDYLAVYVKDGIPMLTRLHGTQEEIDSMFEEVP
jgi:hypothetical protein